MSQLQNLKRQRRATLWIAVRQGTGLIRLGVCNMARSTLEWIPEIWHAVRFTARALAEWVRAWF